MDSGCRLIDLLRRPQLTYDDLTEFDANRPDLPAEVREQVEITVKYEGYIQRQQRQVAEFEKLERRKLPPDMDYDHIQGLRLEAREKLSALRPERGAGRAGIRRVAGGCGGAADLAADTRQGGGRMTAHELTHTIRNDMPVYPGTEQPG